MFRTLTLTTLALLAAGATTSVLAPVTGVSVLTEAEAADFTGRIKTIRIRKRRVGSGFKVSAQTRSDGSGDDIDSAVAVLTDADGQTIESVQLGAAFHGTVVASASTTDEEMGDTLTLSLSGDDLDESITVDLKKGKGDGANAQGWKAKATLNEQGTLRVVVKHEDRDWDGGSLSGVSVVGENSSDALSMELEGNDSTLEATLSTDLDAYSTVSATVTLYNASGEALESVSQGFEFEGTEPEGLQDIQLFGLSSSDAEMKLTTWTWADGGAESLEVEVLDAETGESVLMTVDDQPVQTRHDFIAAMDFDPGESPAGYVYLVLIDYLDEAGDPLGQQQEIELSIPGFDGTAVGYEYGYSPDGDTALTALNAENGLFLFMSYTGDEPIAGANVIFEEPYEGPAPLDTEYSLAAYASWDKWVQVSESDLPAQWETTITATTAEGEVLSSETVTGSGGETYARTDADPPSSFVVNLTARGNLDVANDLSAHNSDDDDGSSSGDDASGCATPWIPWSCS